MAVLRRIIDWANTLPTWQREAVRRLLRQQALTLQDEEELYAMLMAGQDSSYTEQPQLVEPKPIPKLIEGDADQKRRVVLRKMHSLRNVNALAEGQCVHFAESGVTVLYGDNAAGKSGYSRVLKKACQAREKKSEVLPNVLEARSGSLPEATFDLCVEGDEVQEKWVADGPSAETLSQIAVFDSECARVFVDKANEVVYVPYGLDVFQKLASLCTRFKDRLNKEIDALPPPPHVLTEFSQDTAVGKLVGSLKHDTPVKSLEELGNLSDAESKRLVNLRKLVAGLKVNNPKVNAERLRRQKRRFEKMHTAIQELDKTLSPKRLQSLQSLRNDAEAAKNAARLASTEAFEREPLRGVGSDPWRELFQAAKRYSELIAYQDQPFPVISDDARCVLCQQPFEAEARQRLQRFAEFVRRDTARLHAEKSEAFDSAVKAFGDTDFQPERHDSELLEELREIESIAADQLGTYLNSARARAVAIQKACQNGEWEGIPALEESPAAIIRPIMDNLEAEARTQDDVAKPEKQARLEAELWESDDRERLATHKDEILTHLKRLQDEHRLRQRVAATGTSGITRMEKVLTQEAITAKLEKALQNELAQFGLTHLSLTFKKTGRCGQTRHQLHFSAGRIGNSDLSDVLSEGEKNVVALASFLAELETSSDNCGIVLDDPMCSLDHLYRQKVAERLVSEGVKRQVIVFTHDIVFLLAINSAAAKQQVPLLTQTIRKRGHKPGICESGLPWHAMNVKERIKHVRSVLVEAKTFHKTDDVDTYEALVNRIYGLLRETWERAVEEVLLNDAVSRFRPSVETRRLQSVKREDSDYVTIDDEMAKCSTWMTGHDSSGAIAAPMPDPCAIETDITQLQDFVRMIRERHDSVRKTRKQALEPPSALRPH